MPGLEQTVEKETTKDIIIQKMAADETADRELDQGSILGMFNLVRRGATASQWEEWIRIPLEYAAASGELQLVNALLSAGAELKAGWEGKYGRTLLMAAVDGGEPEVVKALLTAGASRDIHFRSGSFFWSPLHVAAFHGNRPVAKLLMQAGAKVKSKDRAGDTPLHIAASKGHMQMVSDLLAHGASMKAKNNNGNTALHHAAEHNRCEIVSLLIRNGAKVDALNYDFGSPLCVAVHNGHVSTTNALLVAGADTSLRIGGSCNDYSPLDIAARDGDTDIMRMLLRHKVDVMFADADGMTALHHAASADNADAVDLLVEAGADIEALEEDGEWRPLHRAAAAGSCDAALALLRHKAIVDAQDADGCGPLSIACSFLKGAVVDLLLRWGADETGNGEGVDSNIELIGTEIPRCERESRTNDVEHLRQLLESAPVDRIWRRRGLLVLCRSLIPKRAHLGSNNGQVVGGMVTKGTMSGRAAKRRQTKESGQEGDIGEYPEVPSVEAMVVGLEVEGIFRAIVMFL